MGIKREHLIGRITHFIGKMYQFPIIISLNGIPLVYRYLVPWIFSIEKPLPKISEALRKITNEDGSCSCRTFFK